MSGERNIDAIEVTYDPTTSGAGVRDVQRAIDFAEAEAEAALGGAAAAQADIDAHEAMTAVAGHGTVGAHDHTTTANGGQLGTGAYQDGSVSLAKQADMADTRLVGRAVGAGLGPPQVLTSAQALAILGLDSGAALSLWGRASNSAGARADIAATAASGAALRESGSAIGFGTLAAAAYGANTVGDAAIRQGAARSVIGVTGNATANVADIQGSTADHVLRISGAGTALAFGQLGLGAFPTNLVTYAKVQQVASANRFLGSTTAAADIKELTAVQAVANLITGLGFHYACYYGGAVTLATGSDTVIALGTTQVQSGTFSIASNVITVANAQVALLVIYSVMLEGTVSGQAQSWIELHEDPNTGTFAAVTGTRKEGCVDAGNTSLDRVTICHSFIVMPGASYKYKLVGQIRSGAATVKTVAAGSSITLVGVSNA